jgi:hypothetical protein
MIDTISDYLFLIYNYSNINNGLLNTTNEYKNMRNNILRYTLELFNKKQYKLNEYLNNIDEIITNSNYINNEIVFKKKIKNILEKITDLTQLFKIITLNANVNANAITNNKDTNANAITNNANVNANVNANNTNTNANVNANANNTNANVNANNTNANVNVNAITINKKKKKLKIPATIKRLVWNTYIGENIGKSKCLCCNLTDITQLNFSCGHIISEYYGGKISIDNLKPICLSCNLSMGTQNMNDFIKNYFK